MNNYDLNYELEREQISLNPNAIVSITNALGEITYVSNQFCELSGYNASELLNQNHRILKSGKHTNDFYLTLWQTISSGQIWQSDICNKAKNGALYCVRATIVPYLDDSGIPSKYISYLTDITDLKYNEEYLNLTVSATGDGIWRWNIESGEFIVSSVYEAMLGYGEGEIIPHIDSWRDSVHPEDMSRVKTSLRDYFEHKADLYQVEVRLRCKDNSWKWILCRGKVIYENDAGQPVSMMGLHTDITSKKKDEAALLDMNAELDKRVAMEVEQNRKKDFLLQEKTRLASMGEMIGNISHQWRQPLNALNLILYDIDDSFRHGQCDSDSLSKSVAEANDLIMHMSQTIDNFRDFFKPQKQRTEFNLKDTILQCINIIESAFMYDHIKLEMDFPDSSEMMVASYRSELIEVIMCLLGNAREAILANQEKNGQIQILVKTTASNHIISVTDNGGGIPDDILPKIFEPYYTSKVQGTGMGLYMSRVMVESHMHGQLTVKNSSNGAMFSIILPK